MYKKRVKEEGYNICIRRGLKKRVTIYA